MAISGQPSVITPASARPVIHDISISVNTVPMSSRPSRMDRPEEHTSELQSLMRISYAVFCLTKRNNLITTVINKQSQTHRIYTAALYQYPLDTQPKSVQ